ncbi:MAG: metallophosphoesterase family protein [Bacteroidota bacterium]
MRLALFSDVHANLQALEAVLAHIDATGADRLVCLGDTVGYNADPKPCLDLVRERCDVILLGNHDRAVALGDEIHHLPGDGQAAATLHRTLLAEDDLAYLAALPLVVDEEPCTYTHASPERPGDWLRLESFWQVKGQFDHFATEVCFIAHSHLPGIVSNKLGVLSVRQGPRYLINVGSVGQPRDGDPRACVAFFDTETWSYRLDRVGYDVEATVRQINEAGLPKRLGERLRRGI